MRFVFVPGFTQKPSSWAQVCAAMPTPVDLNALDVSAGLDWVDAVAQLAHKGGTGTWVGYSMGGRLALAVALDHAHLVERLVLISATAGITDFDEGSTRRASDEELARSIERNGVDPFIDTWVAQPMFERVRAEAVGIDERRSWRADELAAILRRLGTGTMPDLWPRLSELAMPITIVTGSHDPKFTTIGDEMAAACTSAVVQRVQLDAGHAAHLEQPAAIAEILTISPTSRS